VSASGRAPQSDRSLRRELLILRAELQRQELAAAARDCQRALAPALQFAQSLQGLTRAEPLRGGLRWFGRHPLAATMLTSLLGRLGGALAGRVIRGRVGRLGGHLALGAALLAVATGAVKWWRSRSS